MGRGLALCYFKRKHFGLDLMIWRKWQDLKPHPVSLPHLVHHFILN